jgi:membrane protease YdiL (CAAX protease family)
MILPTTIIIGILSFQHKLWTDTVFTDIWYLFCLGILIASCNEAQYRIFILSITTMEEIVFRGILLRGVENNLQNNILSGIIFGLYGMCYIPKFSVMLAYGIIGYFLAFARRKMSILELSVWRTVFYLIVIN